MSKKTRSPKNKSICKIVSRIQKRTGIDDEEATIIQHMIESIVENREKRIRYLENLVRPREFVLTKKDISGALRCCIHAHGPIVPNNIESATKRIYTQCIKLMETNQ